MTAQPSVLRQRKNRSMGARFPAAPESRGGDFVTTGSGVRLRCFVPFLATGMATGGLHTPGRGMAAGQCYHSRREISVWLISKPISRAVVPHVGPCGHCVANRDILTIGTSAGGSKRCASSPVNSRLFPASVPGDPSADNSARHYAILTQAGPLPLLSLWMARSLQLGSGPATN
jgi:hypothetical protein